MPIDPTILQSPPLPPPRVIVLCFDGTDSKFDDTNTNIVKFHGLLKKSCPLEQIVYYQAGVGTYVNPGVVSPWLTPLAKLSDLLFASHLGDHVKSGYRFLMQNYRDKDKVCLFGFSRGAHTARALAGMLHRIGLLPRDNDEQIAFAYDLYKTDDDGDALADGFKRTFCTPVPIKFIGVWDTVSSVGLVYGRDLPFSAGNSNVEIFRHALSLDERRARFQPRLYRVETPKETAKRMNRPKSASHVNSFAVPQSPESSKMANPHRRPRLGLDVAVRRLSSQGQYQTPGTSSRSPSDSDSLSPEGNEFSITSSKPPDFPRVLEVWFAGCHSDVGGGSVEDTVRYSLGDISLRWMVKQVLLSDCGIMFDDAALARADIDVSTIVLASPAQQTVEQPWRRRSGAGTATTSSAPLTLPEGGDGEDDTIPEGNKKVLEAQILSQVPEVRADIHDELKFSFRKLSWSFLGYWVLETIIPATFIWQDADGEEKRKHLRLNFGKGRIIRSDPLYFHESVRQREIVTDPEYKYRGRPTWKERCGDRKPQYVH